MRTPSQTLSELLGKLYDAAMNPSRWEEFLGDVAEKTEGDSAAILIHNFETPLHDVYRQSNISSRALNSYHLYYSAKDLWTQRGNQISGDTWIGPSEALCPTRDLNRSEFFNDFLLPNGIGHALFAFIDRSQQAIMNLSVYRSTRGGAFGPENLELLSLLQPHLKRAMNLHGRFAELEGRVQSLSIAIEHVAHSIIFLDSSCQLIFANECALRILKRGDGIRLTGNRLRAGTQSESALMEKLVREAAATANRRGTGTGGSASISRKSLPPLQLVIMPVPLLEIGLPQRAAVVLFVVEPEEQSISCGELLKTAFGLTSAEVRVALMIAQGISIAEIAQELAVSRNTLKSQIASIYSKTGVTRQSQLARIVLQFPQGSCAREHGL